MKQLIEKINTESFCDYSMNSISADKIQMFSKLVFKMYGTELDKFYLEFITELNGFELNGLNFYGTIENPTLYILSAIKQNEFWKSELTTLVDYYLIGDGDMDFYCFDSKCGEYVVFNKGSLEEVSRSAFFSEFINEIINIYA